MGEREVRAYKKTNWSISECLILQAAKREENEKHYKQRVAKEKWLAIEDYCWERNVHRSGQQCKDRWYRMALEFKKVYEYQREISDGKPSYWQLTGSDRKEGRLPIGFQQEIYDALVDWFFNCKLGNLVIDTSVPSPADEEGLLPILSSMPSEISRPCGHQDASNENCSESDGGDSGNQSGQSVGKTKKRKTEAKAAEGLGATAERNEVSSHKAMLESEDRKDRRLEKQLGAKERLVTQQLEAAERLAARQLEVEERIASNYVAAIMSLADALRSFTAPKNDS